MWNPQAIELLFLSLVICVFLAVVLIVLNCVTSCHSNCSRERRKSSVERLPDNYVNEIHRLLDRHRRVMNEYDYPQSDDGIMTPDSEPLPPITESLLGTPIKLRSRSNSVKLQKLKDELEEFRVEGSPASPDMGEDRRRTWGGLNDSIFDPVEMPERNERILMLGDIRAIETKNRPICDAGHIVVIERPQCSPMKIETTV